MAEYFDISFIVDKKKINLFGIEQAFGEKFMLKQGLNLLKTSKFSVLKKKELLFSIFDNKCNFVELVLSFPNIQFHRTSFEDEIAKFFQFIKACFELDSNILYALCSYELNGYLLNNLRKWENIDKSLLSKFPLVFFNSNNDDISIEISNLTKSGIIVNVEAQDIFKD